MFQLTTDEYPIVIPLLRVADHKAVYAYSVIEHIQSGKIFVNHKTQPTSCLIANNGGKYFLAGDPYDEAFNDDIVLFLTDPQNHVLYFDLYCSTSDWLPLLHDKMTSLTVTLYHSSFRFNASKFALAANTMQELPEGMELRPMDAGLFEQFRTENPHYHTLWPSTPDFMKFGLGYCILADQRIVSACTSFAVGDGKTEIDIMTQEQFQRKGLATMVCCAFIKHCLTVQLIPNWGCDSGNQASLQLALKLGFEQTNHRQMFWWHENKEIMQRYLTSSSY